MTKIFLIAGFGAIGTLLRYALDSLVISQVVTHFPLATFITNIIGSFLIGTLYVLGTEKGFVSAQLSTALTVGLLGGFTTFSSYSLQTILLGEQKQFFAASAYFVCSPVVGVFAAWLGASATRWASH